MSPAAVDEATSSATRQTNGCCEKASEGVAVDAAVDSRSHPRSASGAGKVVTSSAVATKASAAASRRDVTGARVSMNAAAPAPAMPPKTPPEAIGPKSLRPCAEVNICAPSSQNCSVSVPPMRPIAT